MEPLAAIAAARAQAAELLTDTVLIGHPATVTDSTRYGSPQRAWTDEPTPHAAIVQESNNMPRGAGTDTADVTVASYVVKLAAGTALAPGDRVTVVNSVLTPALNGVHLYVQRAGTQTFAVLLRALCTRSQPARVRP